MKLKEKALLFAPMVLILSMVCASTYAYVPQRDFKLTDVFLTNNTIYIRDKENNHWQLSADCDFDLRLSDKPEVKIHSKIVKDGSRVTIRTKDDRKNCRISSLVKL